MERVSSRNHKICKNKGIIDVIINTNGLLLDEELSRELINSGLDQIIFSVDGNSEQTYKNIRTNGDFNRLISNIEKFLSLRNSTGKQKPLVRAQMVKMDFNLHEVDSFVKR